MCNYTKYTSTVGTYDNINFKENVCFSDYNQFILYIIYIYLTNERFFLKMSNCK